jgi:hypothetical protein
MIEVGDLCECRICFNEFPAREDEDGDLETEECYLCEQDRISQMCWERDNFGD